MNISKRWWLLIALFCASLRSVPAQESRATLHGQVLDQQSSVVAGATVTVTSQDTQVRHETTTNGEGSWTIPFLNPGAYSLRVSAPGFKSVEQAGIVLQTADSKQIDFTLELGSRSEHITVRAQVPLIDTTSATSGTVITTNQVTEMPSLSRVPTLLAGLSPGVLLKDQNQNLVNMWSYIGASAISVNGGRDDRSNEFLLDGMPNQHGDKVAYIPSTDAIEEFRVMTNAYDAQYGRQAGATINMSVKSGTNHYHGNLYDYVRNTVFNANLFQTNLANGTRPPTHFNLYGATFGGPVFIPKIYHGKDRTFFFVSFEGTRNQDPRFTIRSVPTEKERNGDFSESFTTKPGDPKHYPIIIYDPRTVDRTTGRRTPFANNVIPLDRISPIAKKIIAFVPLPNTASASSGNAVNNFVPNSTRNNKMASVLTRVDHSWNDRHKSFVSVRWDHEDELLGDDFHNVSTGGSGSRINHGAGFDHVWTIAPTKLLNLRFNVTRFEEPSFSHGTNFNPEQLGFSHDFVAKMERLSFPRIDGVFGIGGGAGGYTAYTYYNWNANLTHIHGNMTFHYGGEYRILQEAGGSYGNQSGQFGFGNQWTRVRYNAGDFATGHSLADFLLGLPGGGGFSRNANRFDSQRYYALYLQNNWRVTPRLTLNLGLRWDFERPFIERYNRMTSDFDPTALNPISDSAQAAYTKILQDVLANPKKYPFGPQLASLVPASSFKIYGAQLFNGVNGHRRASVNGDYHEWQPRAGFAYRIKERTVVRGGFGRFTQAAGPKGGQNGFSRFTPFTSSLDNGLTPYDTLANPFRNGILEPTGSSLGPLTNLGQGVNWDNQDPGHPYSWEYSVHLQQEYKGWLFELGYSHNKTYNIYWGLDQNLQPFDLWRSLRVPRFDSAGKPLESTDNIKDHAYLWDDQIPNPFKDLPGVSGGISTAPLISLGQLLRPIKILGGVGRNANPWGSNQYDAMQMKIEHRFSKGFSLLAAYTFSKLFEDTSLWGPEIAGAVPEHKLGGEDRPHIVSVAPIWEMPVGRGRRFGGGMPRALDAVVGGWELSGTFRIQSGVPIVIGSNYFYDGKNFALSRGERTLDRWFDTSHFVRYPGKDDNILTWPAWTGVQNLPGASYKPSVGTDPRNGVYQDFGTVVWRQPTRWAHARNDRVNEVNLAIMKNFKPTEGTKIQFRAEMFNAFNHPRFGELHTSPYDNDFGKMNPVQLNQARIIQLALKIYF
ncbi:MAG TPA: TonB-dependent receptor [Candidatus Dormibacteraeota bacterium]|nr:TonB-dependent receptor [Candidatus Dormibacteraeota bacterium]